VDVETFKGLTDGLFRKLLGLILVVGGGAFLWKAAFFKDGSYIKEVMGFVMGTALTTVIAFYYHTSQSSADKTKQMTEIIKNGDNNGRLIDAETEQKLPVS